MPVIAPPFRHEALFYDGEAGFLEGTCGFIRGGVDRGQPVLAMVSGPKIGKLRAALGSVADAVHFADMDEIGRNPSRIIPAWRAFVDGQGTPPAAMRGIGEPIDARRD